MTTLNDLIESIGSSLRSFTGIQEEMTWITETCDETQTTLPVAASDVVMRGIAEIEDELIYVDSTTADGLVLPPFGRGFRGTTAASHNPGTKITWDPIFPRAEIRRAINQCIESLFPTLYQIKTTTLTVNPSVVGYELPSDCEGVLTITTRLRLDHRIDVGGGERVPSVAVDFEDTGCGIPEAVRDRIATPFFTTKARGTGLGLALARHFVTQHGGTLHIESGTGRGTRVRVSLPLRRSA